MTPKNWTILSIIACVLALLGAGSMYAFQQQSFEDTGSTAAALHVSSSSFADGQGMPQKLTCDGASVSPDLQWSAGPAGTKSYVIVTTDPDAPISFTHWLAYNIPAQTHGLPEGASTPSKRLEQASEGTNGFGNTGYGGPCPPGDKVHHYVFRVYALDVNPGLATGQGKEQVAAAMQGHVLARGQITGVYGRQG
jgi:Raf kinase inhibitor-like YbhB/YbcL family protein